MSSPIARRNYGFVHRLFIAFHRKFSHGGRVSMLARYFSDEISQLELGSALKCLDLGCGDMSVSRSIIVPGVDLDWICADVYPLSDLQQESPGWHRYRQIGPKGSLELGSDFDTALVCDVLHHSGKDCRKLLSDVSHQAKVILVKDHFENSLFDRARLWVLDFFGNWAYGVPLPNKYFRRREFEQLLAEIGIQKYKIRENIEIYPRGILSIIFPSRLQFIAILETGR